MIRDNVPGQEAEKMVAEGGRILEHRLDEKGKHVCKVETLDAPAAQEEPAPRKRAGRPKASKG